MLVPVDYKKVQSKLNAYCPAQEFTEAQAAEAFHNLVGFVHLLMEVEKEICLRKKRVLQHADSKH
jgi:hypothetical protein